MASNELRKRANWQTDSGNKARDVESQFHRAVRSGLNAVYPGRFNVIKQVRQFDSLYSTHKLSRETLEAIYNVEMKNNDGNEIYKWGIVMDFAIVNKLNGKTIFGEIKRQDGWVEGGSMSDGRGNAHERSCKYFTPGLLKALKKASKLDTDDILPFWVVFTGDITRDPKRNREISFWYDDYQDNFYMWRDVKDAGPLLDHFENKILPYLLD